MSERVKPLEVVQERNSLLELLKRNAILLAS